MGTVTADQMRELEQAAFRAGSSAGGLMAIAGRRLGIAFQQFFPEPGTVVAYLGKGHNAGDALVALRVLREAGWQVAVRAAYPEVEWASLTRAMARELGDFDRLHAPPHRMETKRPLVLLDGLLGIGAKGALRGMSAALAAEMAQLRQIAGARVAAVDLPSGIDPDRGEIYPKAVQADVTFTIGVPKRGLLMAEAVNAVGALVLVPVEELPVPAGGDLQMTAPWTLAAGQSPRAFDFHKGMAGRVGILAGSHAYTGAAVLAATGALRGGAGLVTLHVPEDAAASISAKCPPEVMVQIIHNPIEMLDHPYDSLVIGPGLGKVSSTGLRALLDHASTPCVIDADALNALAESGGIGELGARHVLTPHPGEFRRLAPDLAELPREQAARAFADRHAPVLLFKGARTLVTQKGAPLWVNPTGTPGMASGGQGDSLSGVIGALMAGGIPPLEAAALGAWLCGRASERAMTACETSEESLLATDTLDHLGGAFRDWREFCR